MMKKVVIASKNQCKVDAFKAALQRCNFDVSKIEIVSCSVDSGVSPQPFSVEETRRGALNRCRGALSAVPDADFSVSAEGGIEFLDDDPVFNNNNSSSSSGGGAAAVAEEGAQPLGKSGWIVGWCCLVRRADGAVSFGSSARLPLPKPFEVEIRGGKELSQIIDAASNANDLRSSLGVEGLLTAGALLRGDAYTQGFICALSRFVSPKEFW